ncbi:MAG: Jag N-terminal domain-containing protein [Acidimicrobiales bacterium]|nr:Jag N-terminal domain-containing protein [Acidimicrobiales bacterium]
MEWIETTGSSLDEAKERALDRLGVAEDELEVEVLSEPTRSMFGFKKSEARLRARVRPTSPRPKVERRDRNRRNDRKDGKGRSSDGRQDQQGGRGSRDSRQGSSGEGGRDDGNRRRRGNDRPSARQQDQSAPPTGGDGDNGQGNGKSDRRRENGGQSASRKSSAKSTNGNGRGNDRERAEAEVMDLQTQAGITEGFVQGLLDAMGLEARVESTIEEDRLTVEAHGLNLGLAIGNRGDTVRAITELSRTLVQRSSDGQAEGSLVVDIGGYRERRRSFLADFARSQAEAVLDDGRSRTMEPMAAADRKVIHDTIGEIDGLETISEGSGTDRQVVIMVETTG